MERKHKTSIELERYKARMTLIKRLNKLGVLKEKYLFGLVILLSISPFLGVTFVPSLDGPAHLYNSNLILELLEENDFISRFYSLTSSPNPNLTGHVFLSFLLLIFPAFLAEKILLIFYVVGFAYFFRKLILVQNSKGVWLTYLAFPFIYSFVFALGFYNFSLGIVFLLWGLYFWIKNEKKKLNTPELATLFFLFTLTFFSHIFVYAVLILVVCTRLLFSFFKTNPRISATRKLKEFSFSSIVSIGLFIFYFASRPIVHNSTHKSLITLMEDIFTFNPLVSYSKGRESVFLALVGCVILYLLALVFRAKKKKWSKENLVKDSWLILSLFLFIAYFILPDSNSLGGFINTRVALVFYLLLIIWIGIHHLANKLIIPAIVILLFAHYQLVDYYSHCIKNLNEVAEHCHEMEEHIEENNVVIPLHFSGDWMKGHFSNYLGTEKPLVILDNYEAVNDYFATEWNWEYLGEELYKNMSVNNFNCLNKFSYVNQERLGQVYIFILGDIESQKDPCMTDKKEEINKYFYPVAKNKHCSLYRMKKS